MERVLLLKPLFGTEINLFWIRMELISQKNITHEHNSHWKIDLLRKVWNLISIFLFHSCWYSWFPSYIFVTFPPPKAFNHSSRKNVHISDSVEGILKKANSTYVLYEEKSLCIDRTQFCEKFIILFSVGLFRNSTCLEFAKLAKLFFMYEFCAGSVGGRLESNFPQSQQRAVKVSRSYKVFKWGFEEFWNFLIWNF